MLILFALAGAVVNLAVAWSYPLWPDPNQWETTEVDVASDFWSEAVPPDWPPCGTVGRRTRSAVLTVDMRYVDVTSPSPALGRYASGFPLRCVRSYVRFEGANGSVRSVRHGLELADAPLIVLGLSPVWPGFAINTALYAAALWLLIAGPFAVRRLLRSRRGRCVACGYDLARGRGGACPECGRSAPSPGTSDRTREPLGPAA
ncbi:MAG: hypothetical protein ACYTJ0_19020 [Planctomycetota bacterium]